MSKLQEQLLLTRRLAWENGYLDAVSAIDALIQVITVAEATRSD